MTPMPTELMIKLRDTFTTYFDEQGLIDFTLAMGIDYENIPGPTKSAKARELALHLWRHSKLAQLAETGAKLRPDIDWSFLGPPAGNNVPDSSARLSYTELQQLVPILADYPLFQTPDGRKSVLTLAGVATFTNVDLNGSARLVASNLLVQLNAYGKTADGDYAVGRLLGLMQSDDALPPAHRETIAEAIVKLTIN